MNTTSRRAQSNNTFTTVFAGIPTVNDDSSLGYEISSQWFDSLTKNVYICEDASVGAAVWTQTSGGGSSGGGGTKLAIDTTDVVLTGTVTETVLYTIPIPAGTLGTNNAIRFNLISSNGSFAGGSMTLRAKYGGTTVAVALTKSPAGDADISGFIIADNATNAQKGSMTVSVEGNTTESVDFGTATVDSTLVQNLVITGQLADVGDSFEAEAIIVEEISTGAGIQTREVNLTSADILALNTTPFELVPAPGTGKVIVVSSAVISLDAGATPYAGGSTVEVNYGGDAVALVLAFSDIQSATDSIGLCPTNDAMLPITVGVNQPVELKNNGAAFTTGDGTLKVFITYQIITL